MAVEQNIALPVHWARFFKKYWLRLALTGAVLLAVTLTAAIRAGMRRSADAKASALFARAKTVEDYQAILGQVPESYLTFDILFNIAQLHYQQGNSSQAGTYFQKALVSASPGLQSDAAKKALALIASEQGPKQQKD